MSNYTCNFCFDYGCFKCTGAGGDQAIAALKNFRLQNPIPDEVCDAEELKRFFKNRKYIPYAGYSYDSQHSILHFINNLATLSPTLSGVINSKLYACFGGKTNIKKISDQDFDFTSQTDNVQLESDISIDLKKNFADFLKTFDLSGKTWSSIKTTGGQSLMSNGNSFLEVDIVNSLGVYKIKLTVHQTKNCLYKIPTLFERTIAISKSWDSAYLKKYAPDEIPAYPQFQKTTDSKGNIKRIRTIIHTKLGEYDYYGRPDWWSCANDAFLEIKNKEYLLTMSHNKFTPTMIIEFEGESGNSTALDDEEAKKKGYRDAMHRWRHNTTNQGNNPQGLLVLERPFGAKELFVHEPNLNLNENFYEKVDDMTTAKIILANAWSRKLANIESKTGLSNNSFVDDMKTRMPVIEHYQNIIDNNLFNTAIQFVVSQLEITEFEGLGTESKNPFDHLIKAAQDSNLQQPQVQPVHVVNN